MQLTAGNDNGGCNSGDHTEDIGSSQGRLPLNSKTEKLLTPAYPDATLCARGLKERNPGKDYTIQTVEMDAIGAKHYRVYEYVETTPDATVLIPSECSPQRLVSFFDRYTSEETAGRCAGLLQRKTGKPHYVLRYESMQPFGGSVHTYFAVSQAVKLTFPPVRK